MDVFKKHAKKGKNSDEQSKQQVKNVRDLGSKNKPPRYYVIHFTL